MGDHKRAGRALERVDAVLQADIITDESRRATEAEHRATVRDALRGYPNAVAWSAFFSIAVIMTGYDCQIITSFYAQPAFQRKYGYEYPPGSGYGVFLS
jgi:MFS transporter, SP family, general alpha glucoside:H+ symporter